MSMCMVDAELRDGHCKVLDHFLSLTNDVMCNVAAFGGEQLRIRFDDLLKLNDRVARRESSDFLEGRLLVALSECPELSVMKSRIACRPATNGNSRCWQGWTWGRRRRGCRRCQGFQTRLLLFELLEISRAVRCLESEMQSKQWSRD